MRNHSQDDFDGGRAASLTTQEAPDNLARDLRRRWMGAGDQDDLALALAMLALSEGSEL